MSGSEKHTRTSMTRHLWAVLVFAVLSVSGQRADAEAITVEAAELDDATRIGLAIGDRPFLVDAAGPRQLDIVIPETGIAFDLGALLVAGRGLRIDAARALLDENSSRIRVVMNCDCTVSADIQSGMLWVSLRDALKPNGADQEAEPAAPQTAPERLRRFASAHAPVQAPSPWPRGVAPPSHSEGPEIEEGDKRSPVASDGNSGAKSDTASEVELAREALIRQLARAAEQGLLDYSSQQSAELFNASDVTEPDPLDRDSRAPVAGVASAEETAASDQIPAPAETPRSAPSPDASPIVRPKSAEIEVPVRARTALDKNFRADRGETWVRRVECLPDAAFEMPDAGTPEAAHLRLGHLKNNLVDEFDQFDATAMEELARLWISMGFGAEARAVLGLMADPIPGQELLNDLALIVDGERPSVAGPLALMGPCSAVAAIWFEAAGFQLESGAAERMSPAYAAAPHAGKRTAEMVERFGGMPVNLRVLLGPKLMRSRLDRGDVPTAELLDLLLRRMVAPPSAEHDLARARLLLISHQSEQANGLFRRLAAQQVPEARDALLQLADQVYSRDGRPDHGLADALGDAAMLARGGQDYRRLKVAEIRTRALSEGIGPALDQVVEALRRVPEDDAVLIDAAHAALETATADEGDPLGYAQAVLSHADLISRFPSGDQARHRVASELTRIGLANAALRILAPATARAVPVLLRDEARAHVSMGDGEGALQALRDLPDPASSDLRAEALLLLSRPREAFAELASQPAPDAVEQARFALLAGNWSEASREGPAARRILAAGMAQGTPGAEVLNGGGIPAPGPQATDAPRASEPALLELETQTPGAADALLTPAQMGEAVTLHDAQAVIEGSRAVRGLIEEALPNG